MSDVDEDTIREALERERREIAHLTAGMPAETAWKYLEGIDAALAALVRLGERARQAEPQELGGDRSAVASSGGGIDGAGSRTCGIQGREGTSKTRA